jgi:UDP-N-acetylmuramoylalanine--D-glutamate ligase
MTQKQLHFELQNLLYQSSKNIYWILGGLPKKNDKINLSNIKKILLNVINWKKYKFFKKQIKNK